MTGKNCDVLIKLLKSLQSVTTVLRADDNVTMSMVRTIASSLLSNTFKIKKISSDNELTVKFKSIISKDLSGGFGFDIR